jgi:xanthine dehydrogenase accessory factor
VTESSSLRGVLDALRARTARGESVALAIVVETQGSTYRKPGALAVVASDGTRHGVISGGCLERELERLGAQALSTGFPCALTFDTQGDDDLLFGSGSGCRGRMVVIAVPLRATPDAALIADILALADSTTPLAVASRCAGDVVTALSIGTHHVAVQPLSPNNASGPLHVREITIAPAPCLLLIGAGPEAPPLARLARALGWQVSVADHRAALTHAQRLPDADRLLVARAGAAIDAWRGVAFTAAIAMTHSAAADAEALSGLAQTACPYIGLLGPPRRRDELLAQLDDTTRAALTGRLHAPVGLSLGGDGPEAIALSVIAELQRTFQPR